jgi:polyisoprenoid-binding protein YceI
MTSSSSPRKSKRIWFILAGIMGVLVIAVVGGYLFLFQDEDPGLATSAPDLPTPVQTARPTSSAASATTVPTQQTQTTTSTSSSSTTASPTVPTATPPSATQPPSDVSHFVIDPAQSSGRFVVETTVLGFKSTSVATADEVTGEFHVTPKGLSVTGDSDFRMDLRNLTSDDALLRRFLASGAFDTENFPYADFVAESTSEFPPEYGTGEQFTYTLTGTLTMNGVSQPVTWEVLARQSGDFFSATADTDLVLSQFNVEVPDTPLGGASDTVHVQVVMIAARG